MTKVIFPPKLKEIIINLVVTPILNHPHTPAWDREVSSKLQADQTFDNLTKDYHRLTICGQGQADFRNGNFGLSADDIALLYSYYFFQMHFTSSVALYFKYQNELVSIFHQSDTICFIDIGCGPYTSGFGFLYFTQVQGVKEKLADRIGKTQLEYYGIDNADSMTKLGDIIYEDYTKTLTEDDFKYAVIKKNSDYNGLAELIGKRSQGTTFIINCCYFFASQTMNVGDLTAAVQSVINNNPTCKVVLFYQNAPATIVGQNYLNFRSAIKGLIPHAPNIEQLRFSYDDEFKSAKRPTLNLNVCFQLLKNY